jgi:hypothetical protein
MKSKQLALAIGVILWVLSSRADGVADQVPPIIWGSTTNGLRAGVGLQRSLKEGSDVKCLTVIYFGITNLATEVRAYCPKTEELFSAELIDSRGTPVPKTRLGASFGRAPAPHAKLSDRPPGGPKRWQICIVTADHENQVADFNIMDYFSTPEPGMYRLTVELRLYERGTNGTLNLFRPPVVSLSVRVP